MKKLLLLMVLALGAFGLWRISRRGPVVAAPEEERASFRAMGHGALRQLRYEDTRHPLRSLRWLPLQPAGLVGQALTQDDRQRVALLRPEATLQEFQVPRPKAVAEGFFRLAELQDACLAGDILLLRYEAPGRRDETLVVALDQKTFALRWSHMAPGHRLSVSPEGRTAYLWGEGRRITMLDLEAANGRPREVEAPPEVAEVASLLPTPRGGLLIAHAGGLSARPDPRGDWQGCSAPETAEELAPGFAPVLAAGRGRLLWQPRPGLLLEVGKNGEVRSSWNLAELAPEAPPLRLVGDAAGQIWLLPLPPALGPDAARIYGLSPARAQVQAFGLREAWDRLGIPSPVPADAQSLILGPAGLLASGTREAWWIPLEALAPSGALQPR